MAAPADKTIENLNGKWVMNKNLSKKTDEILKLQGVGMILRSTISYATVTLDIKQFNDEATVSHIEIEQTITGGIKGTREERVLDWSERGHSDFIFGDVKGRSKFVQLDGLEAGFGKEEEAWLTEGLEKGERYILSWVANEKNGWEAIQIWGFGTIEGERRHLRNVVVKTKSKKIETKLWYDYVA